MAAYVGEKGYRFDPESFVAFYASKGWKVGKAPMRDWRQACVTWERRRAEEHPDDGDAPRRTDWEAIDLEIERRKRLKGGGDGGNG